jgi:hypothetical protein
VPPWSHRYLVRLAATSRRHSACPYGKPAGPAPHRAAASSRR